MTTKLLAEKAYAKINLALHIRRRREDGYHDIETLFAFCEEGDLIEAAPDARTTLTITGPFAAGLDNGPDNLVLRAATAFCETFGIAGGAALRLEKCLPVAAGIGGGSADAAATLRLLARMWAVTPAGGQLEAIATSLGADVPACLASLPCRGEARGDRLLAIEATKLHRLPVLLVNPGVAMPTGPVFAGWDGIDRGALAEGNPFALALAGRNDLQPPAERLAPVIADVIACLTAAAGATLARMSGSGATCFALFENEAARDAADHAIAVQHPSWWRLSTRLL